jgi:hypothetical protein
MRVLNVLLKFWLISRHEVYMQNCAQVSMFVHSLYDGESVNSSHMDIERKTCDICYCRRYIHKSNYVLACEPSEFRIVPPC